jgi:hypothetical protein
MSNIRLKFSELGQKVFCDRDRIYILPPAAKDYWTKELHEGLQVLRGLRATMKRGPGEMLLANFDSNICTSPFGCYLCIYLVSHGFFTKINVEILQFYMMVKGGLRMTERDLERLSLREYSLNGDQRRELRILLNGKIIGSAVQERFENMYKMLV